MKIFLSRRGQAAVEFSLLLPIFALILFATIYIGFFVMDYVTLDNAAAQAARHAALNDEENYAVLTTDESNIQGTQLFLSWYELQEDACIKSSRGNVSGGEFVPAADGEYVRVMIQATLKADKDETILKDIMPEKYTVSKVAQIP